jgi:hypothetical protein
MADILLKREVSMLSRWRQDAKLPGRVVECLGEQAKGLLGTMGGAGQHLGIVVQAGHEVTKFLPTGVCLRAIGIKKPGARTEFKAKVVGDLPGNQLAAQG